MYYVYILKSLIDGKYYIGQTNNLSDRILRHNQGRVIATKYRKPLELVCFEEFKTRSESVKRESYLKSLKCGNEFFKIINKIQ